MKPRRVTRGDTPSSQLGRQSLDEVPEARALGRVSARARAVPDRDAGAEREHEQPKPVHAPDIRASAAALTDFSILHHFTKLFAKFWRTGDSFSAGSKPIYSSKNSFATFCKLYKICALLHRSKNQFAKCGVTETQNVRSRIRGNKDHIPSLSLAHWIYYRICRNLTLWHSADVL